jgi:spore coat protein U-like protein
MRKSVIACVSVGLALVAGSADAATTTSTFTVDVTIQAQCLINSASNLSFGTQGVLIANVDQTSTIVVQCTDTTTYDIGLDKGTGTGASVATRKLTNGSTTINYSLYTNVGRSTVWGNTVSTDTVSATGNGAAQSYTVYGRIPAQTTPAPNAYSDTITITVTY